MLFLVVKHWYLIYFLFIDCMLSCRVMCLEAETLILFSLLPNYFYRNMTKNLILDYLVSFCSRFSLEPLIALLITCFWSGFWLGMFLWWAFNYLFPLNLKTIILKIAYIIRIWHFKPKRFWPYDWVFHSSGSKQSFLRDSISKGRFSPICCALTPLHTSHKV